MSITKAKRKVMIHRWDAYERTGNRSWYDRAKIMAEVWGFYGGVESAFRKELREGWGVRQRAALDKRVLMAKALTSIPDADVWVAVGWRGIGRLFKNMRLGDYDSIARKIREISNGRGIVPNPLDRVDEILASHGTPRIPLRSKEIVELERDLKLVVNDLVRVKDALGLQDTVLDPRTLEIIDRVGWAEALEVSGAPRS